MSTTTATATTTTPLLTPTENGANIIRPLNSRRLISQPSLRVRHSAAQEIMERRRELTESKPTVVGDLVWNVISVFLIIYAMIVSNDEVTEVPLRLWLIVHAVLCVVHVVCVFAEFRRRRRPNAAVVGPSLSSLIASGRSRSDAEMMAFITQRLHTEDDSSAAKNIENMNATFSFIWWMFGLFWILTGGNMLADDAPKLRWITIFFLGCYVLFFAIFICFAIIVAIAICCCLPCILVVLCRARRQEETSEEVLETLTKYTFKRDESQGAVAGTMIECDTDTPTERTLSAEDAACAICLVEYKNGSELQELPCHHHFHSACIGKWLRTKTTCPLCKYNIQSNDNHSSEEV
ncbi:hypothetical protein vseg_009316 [Gypsophila vaccaria]